MKARIPALLALVALAFSACSDDESPLAPQTPTPSKYVNATTGDE